MGFFTTKIRRSTFLKQFSLQKSGHPPFSCNISYEKLDDPSFSSNFLHKKSWHPPFSWNISHEKTDDQAFPGNHFLEKSDKGYILGNVMPGIKKEFTCSQVPRFSQVLFVNHQ
jgi:hypothetical protein